MTTQPLECTTELEAVNTMLQAVGADPISSIDVSTDSDVMNAQNILAEVSREVQSQGWDFNVDTLYPIPRTVDNEYVVPANVLNIKLSQDFQSVRATWRGKKLWDQEKFTFTWDKALTFDVTWYFAFEDLPQTARHYITMKAARRFQARMLGSDSLGRFTATDEAESRSIFIDAESLDAGHSIFNNYDVYRTLNRWPSSPAQ